MDSHQQIQSPIPDRGATIFVFGILSIFGLGPILGIPAWIMGRNDMKRLRESTIPWSDRSLTRTGMILGIIGTFLMPAIIAIGIIAALMVSLSAH